MSDQAQRGDDEGGRQERNPGRGPDDSRQERKHGDFIQGSLTNVVSWFPGLPGWVKILASAAFLYLVFCMVAQIKPDEAPRAAGMLIREYIDERRAAERQARADERAEREQVIALLRDQLAEARARAEAGQDVRAWVADIDRRLTALEEAHRPKR